MSDSKDSRKKINYDAQNRYLKKMAAQGFVRVTVWIHEQDADELCEFAERKRMARRAA